MSDTNVLKLRLALMGRPVRNYTFDKPLISVGRDPESDVFVDNPGVSRDHFRLERTPAGEYQVVDLGSANGTFLNDQTVNTALLRNNDVVRFGKYTLWVGYDQDRRTGMEEQRRGAADNEKHTIVLSRSELGHVLEKAREKENDPAVAASAPVGQSASPLVVREHAAPSPFVAIAIAFVIGAAIGAAVVWIVLGR
jgi:pSer/pThr/pTyr-binding forkhead associated (FHA) protein